MPTIWSSELEEIWDVKPLRGQQSDYPASQEQKMLKNKIESRKLYNSLELYNDNIWIFLIQNPFT